MNLAALFKERTRLHRELQDRISYGCGSSVEESIQRRIDDTELAIKHLLDFVCPHCGGSLGERPEAERDHGWLRRQLESVSEDVQKWPPWMRREAGLEEQTEMPTIIVGSEIVVAGW